jgi:2-polyprenyl-6-methoxyphenol hydroxylase-like FAD-dependent oxidoreductase
MQDESGRSVAATKHAVVIAGGGPTGLMLAAELALSRVDVAIVERRTSQDVAGSRAGGLHSRTIEVLDQRGIAERFLPQGQVMQIAGFAMIPLDISDFPTRHNYGLALKQEGIERTLAAWASELRVPIYRGLEVTGFAQDDTGVDVELSDGRSLRATYRRMRRRSQPDPQESRYRLPRMGPVHQLFDCRGRDDRRAGVGHPP